MSATIEINRAPVLTLWIAVVSNHMGYSWETSMTIGKVFAGLNAQAKGKLLGIYSVPDGPSKRHGLGEEYWIHIGDKGIPMKDLAEGARAVVKDQPVDPKSVEIYLAKAFGESLAATRSAMEQLAQAFTPEEIGIRAFGLYEKFRPKIASGQRGWGQKGKLDLGAIQELAARP